MNSTHKVLSLCPENTVLEMDGKEAVRVLKEMFPRAEMSETPIEDIHTMFFGHTKKMLAKPI